MTDYTHYRYLVLDKKTGEVVGTVVIPKGISSSSYIKGSEKLGSKIGGMNLRGGN